MSFVWSERSLKALAGIHPDLRKVCDTALLLSEVDFIVVEGCRSREQQLLYFTSGKSKTLHSRHINGFAVDFVALKDGKVTYDAGAMGQVATAFKRAADRLGVPINWGGDWKTFKDTPHVELCWKKYPDPLET